MRRFLVLAALIVAATMSQGAMWIGCSTTTSEPHLAAIERVEDNLYVITGGGGNTAVLVTDAGVVLVDTKLPGWGTAILEKVRTVTEKPVTTIINTHTHGDHVGGNASFGTAVEIVAQQNTKTYLQTEMVALEGYDSRFLPTRTFTEHMSLTSGTDRIDLYYFGPGHTGGDAVVVFPALRTAHAGDLFAGKALPIIDVFHGGSGVRLPETLEKMHEGFKDVDRIITGHGALFGWEDLAEYATFNKDFLAWTMEQMKAGTSAEAASVAYRLPAKYAGYKVQPWQVKTNVERIYAELNRPSTPATRWRGGVQ